MLPHAHEQYINIRLNQFPAIKNIVKEGPKVKIPFI